MTDTTDLLQDGATAPDGQDAPTTTDGSTAAGSAAPRTRRRATSGGLASLVLPELQAMAGQLGISSVGRLRKSQLIEAIQAKQAGGGVAAGGASAPTASAAPVASAPDVPAQAEPEASAPLAEPEGSSRPAARTRRSVGRAGRSAGAPAVDEQSSSPQAERPVADGGTSAPPTSVAGTSDAGGRYAAASAAGSSDAAAPAAGSSDVDASDADTGERVDRGRERFLEREARRQERQAASANGDGQRSADEAPPRERGARADRGERPDRVADRAERPDRGDRTDRSDRGGQTDRSDRPDRSDRYEQQDRQDRSDRNERPDRGDRFDGPASRQDASRTDGRTDGRFDGPGRTDGQQPGLRDDEDGTGRRGRFRERGRGRNRNRTAVGGDRYGSDSEPMVSDDDVLIPVGGILDILDNYGFVRTTGYLTGPNDVYVSLQQVSKYGLRRGDAVTGAVRQQREGERKDKYNALVRLDSVNGMDPAEAHKRPDFTKLTPLYPQDRLRLETEPGILTTRVIDLVMPVGKGQRALIVSPPKAGKTMVMQAIANAITTNNPECHLMVVLVDERPEEVTDMQRSVKGEVIASTFDRPPQDHITVAELSIERAKRLVELGHDVVVLLDSITRLGRAYNLGAPASGRILTGGVDSAALYPPKRFLGAARNIENGGSLTIFATALVETGSAMDTVIFEEFKGTGNAELKLDRRLADKRIFPAIDVDASGTRKEEILLSPEELRIVLQLRRVLHALDTTQSLELLLGKMKSTRTNVEFLMQIQKTTVEAD